MSQSNGRGEVKIIKTFYDNGQLKASIHLKNGKRHGLAKMYYPDGKLWQEVEYLKNIKHGLARTYYESGLLYQESTFYEGKRHGIRKTFRRKGGIMAEIPYHHGKPTAGLKEYLLNGEEKKIYPAIQITPKIGENGNYVLHLSLTDRVKDVEFYFGALDENGLIPSYANRILENEEGVAEITFPRKKGEKVNEMFMVMTRATTILGNPYITEQAHEIIIN